LTTNKRKKWAHEKIPQKEQKMVAVTPGVGSKSSHSGATIDVSGAPSGDLLQEDGTVESIRGRYYDHGKHLVKKMRLWCQRYDFQKGRF
jgi:hypothetical protein